MIRTLALCAAAITAGAGSASATTIITFSGLEHGRIVNNQYAALGVTIAANNVNRPFDLAVAFNTQLTGTADPDLQGPPWSAGNLAPNTVLGNVLIIQENNTGISDGIANNPDDEGNRPAGDFTFTFANPVSTFGLDIVDIENVTSENGGIQLFRNNVKLLDLTWAMLRNPASAYYDPTIVFGDDSANRVQPINASRFGVSGFDRAVIRMGGSGAIDNIVIPAPGAAALAVFGTLVAARRRRSN